MRLIGGRDYYDSALAYGSDPGIVFVREKSAYKAEDFLPEPALRNPILYCMGTGRRYLDRTLDIKLVPLVVYFCGRRYQGIRTELTYKLTYKETHYFWRFEELEEYLNRYGATALEDSKRYFWEKVTPKSYLDHSSIKEADTCIGHGVVVASYERGISPEKPRWRINGDNLKEYEFYRVVAPYPCYQEISMFVGGVLPRPGKPMVEISDKSKIVKHGFNKWSFRKLPETKQ